MTPQLNCLTLPQTDGEFTLDERQTIPSRVQQAELYGQRAIIPGMASQSNVQFATAGTVPGVVVVQFGLPVPLAETSLGQLSPIPLTDRSAAMSVDSSPDIQPPGTFRKPDHVPRGTLR